MQLKKGDRIEEVKDPILIEAFKQSGYTELKAEKVEEPKEAEEVKPKAKKEAEEVKPKAKKEAEEVKPKAKKGNKKGV